MVCFSSFLCVCRWLWDMANEFPLQLLLLASVLVIRLSFGIVLAGRWLVLVAAMLLFPGRSGSLLFLVFVLGLRDVCV